MTALWSRWSTRERVFLVIFSGALAIAVFWQGIVRPFKDFSNELDNRIQSREIRLAKYRHWAQMDIKSGPSPKVFFHAEAPGTAEEEMSIFLKGIEKMARESSVRILNVRPLPIEKKGSYETLTVEVHSDAALLSFAHFIYELNNSPLLFRVPRFTATIGESSGRLHADFVIKRTL